jgi:nucleoside 2-deoxyribosyltransferase
MKTIYLAGPITGESWEGATDWRDYVQQRLNPGIRGLSPLRAKDYLAKEQSIGDSYEAIPLSASRGIMTRDFFDCQNCDIILAYLKEAQNVSIGTVIEIAWSYAFRKPLIAVIEPSVFENGELKEKGNIHDHAMLREAISYRVEELDTAIFIANAILTDYAEDASAHTHSLPVDLMRFGGQGKGRVL